MFSKKIVKTSALCLFALSLSACANRSHQQTASNTDIIQNISVQEKLYNATQDYGKLITMYREVLKSHKFDGTDTADRYRYKLAQAYFNKGDNHSALLYLKPLLDKPRYEQEAMNLQLKALVNLKRYNEALSVARKLIAAYPNNASAYNSQGIAYAQLGQYTDATESFLAARAHFLNDLVAINNLAMIEIIRGQYRNAVQLLLPQYQAGEKDQRLLYNLTFALIKSGNVTYARQIIEKEGLNTNPDALINGLKRTQRASQNVVSRRN